MTSKQHQKLPRTTAIIQLHVRNLYEALYSHNHRLHWFDLLWICCTDCFTTELEQ